MQIRTTVHLGHFHPVYCEDALWVEEMLEGIYLAAVMDGCTMGKESHFVSALMVKLLRKANKDIGYEAWKDPQHSLNTRDLDALGRQVMQKLFADLRKCAQDLYLEERELLTTLNLCLVDTVQHTVWHTVIGDGYSATGQEITDWDQENKPDYIGYHLKEDFDVWYESQQQVRLYRDIHEFVIASDGVAAFEHLNKQARGYPGDVVSFLLREDVFPDSKRPLDKKIAQLEESYGEIATDDVAIIQMRW
ncbi:MAG: protein phosphatase 2C domain-containing protein [Bacteroidota bacterium]